MKPSEKSMTASAPDSASAPVPGPDPSAMAMFGAGCFWGVELAFRQADGVLEATVGYSGGHTENPTYSEVCSGRTGHAEVVQVRFDPSRISYERLLELFFDIHDPTTLNRQGPDLGEQYRSVIFYYGADQAAAARVTRQRLEEAGRWKRPIVTQIEPAGPFYRAEEYHQRYLEKHGRAACPSGRH